MKTSLSHRLRLAGVVVAAGALTLTLAGPAVAHAAPAGTVVPDANFAACLNGILGEPDPAAPITADQLESLTQDVNCFTRGIKSIDGAQYLTSLTRLDLFDNQVSDITPLSGLTNLTTLGLDENHVSDINPLSGLTNLTTLWLDEDQVSDISPLSGLPNLTQLFFDGNQVSDISSLSGLTKLTGLGFSSNQVSDISPLSGLTNLTQLYLDSNQVSDINPLSGLTNLTELLLQDNQISDINPLSGLTNLTTLWLITNQVSDINPLANLTNLTQLFLDANQISDINPLANLTNLTQLSLGLNQISDISPLANLTNLTELYLYSNQIWDISPLSGLTKLTTLDLSSNHISDLSGLPNTPSRWWATYQSLAGMTVAAGDVVGLPAVRPMPGASPVVWSVSSGSATISGATFTANSPGSVSLTWSDSGSSFSGTVNVTVVAPLPTDCGFVDVASTSQYAGNICWMKTTGVTTGTTPTTYSPAANVTRGQMAAFMYRLAGSPTFAPPATPSFSDVPASNEFYTQIEWLKHTGITTGTTPTTYSPAANVTRGQMAAFMYRLAGSPIFSAPAKPSFSDVPVSNEFYKQIEWLKHTGITTGTSPTTYSPVANVTREQMAAFMYRLAQQGYYCTGYPDGVGC